jgi:hypothetical protein
VNEADALQYLDRYKTGMPYETETKYGWRLVFKGVVPLEAERAQALLEHEAAFRKRGYTIIEENGLWILTLWVRLDYISGPKSTPSEKFKANDQTGKTD